MKLDDLIQIAGNNQPVTTAHLEAAAQATRGSIENVLDRCARLVAERFRDGEYSFGFADMAMNQSFHSMCMSTPVGGHLPDFAFAVFGAVDEGEWDHDPWDGPQGEARTRLLLEPLLNQNPQAKQDALP